MRVRTAGFRVRCLGLLSLGSVALWTLQVSAQQRFEDLASVVLVEVPVQVTRGGEAVRGLVVEDFEVFEGRRKVPIVDFEVVDLSSDTLSAGEATGRPLAAVLRRHFLLLFDLSFSDPSSVVRAREAAENLVLEALHPSDLVGVATYSANQGAELVLAFTADTLQVVAAIRNLGATQPLGRLNDPLKIMVAEAAAAAAVEPSGPGQIAGVKAQVADMYLEHLRDQQAQVGVAVRDVSRNQILDLASSFAELARTLRAVDGRKQIVLLSEGFDSSILLGTNDEERIAELANAAASGEFWRVDSNERYGSGAAQSGLARMLDELRRCDCTIQAVDIGGVRAGADVRASASGADGLFLMAESTGGQLYRSFNRLSDAMGKMLESTSVTYLLVLQPRDVQADGSYHPLKVRLKKRHKHLKLAHRPGFYAPRPFHEQEAEERRARAAGRITAGVEGGDLPVHVLTVPFLGLSGESRVLTFVEISGATLLGGYSGDELPAEVYAYALDSEGAVKDFFTQSVVLDLPKVGGRLFDRGLKFVGHLDLGKGEYEIRVLVRNGLTGTYGMRSRRFTVPDLSAGPALAPPLFIEPEGLWVLGWQERDSEADLEYPLTVRNRSLIPAAQPILPAGVESPMLLVTQGLARGAITIDAVLASHDGERVAAAPITLRDRVSTAVPGSERLWTTIRPDSLPPGRYELTVRLRDRRSGRELTSSLDVFVQ